MRFTITPKTHTLGEKTFTSYDVFDNLFVYKRDNGTEVHGRRVATFNTNSDAVDYASWRNRLEYRMQPGDVE